jgi:hypothetical protein
MNLNRFQDDSGRLRERWLWLGTLALALMLIACLGLAVTNAGPGFGPPGQATHLRLVSAVTNYPFCPPSVPCPISAVLPHNNWVVWLIRETQNSAGVDTTYRRLINIPLWY